MSESARVDSIDALAAFRTALLKFQESAVIALGDAEGEMHRMQVWVENEQSAWWQSQIRKRQEIVVRAKEAVRMKKLFKDSSGRQPSAVDEEKALQVALKRLAEAEEKMLSVKKWTRALQKEVELYKGGVQRFATSVHSEIPVAAAHLSALMNKLDAYVSLTPGSAEGGAGEASAAMSRGGEDGEPPIIPIAPIPAAQQTVLFRFRSDSEPPTDDSAVVRIADGIGPSDSILVTRIAPTDTADSGRRIVPISATEPDAWRSIELRNILRARPDLEDLLSLPVGFSVMMDAAGVVRITNPAGETVWNRPELPNPADEPVPEDD